MKIETIKDVRLAGVDHPMGSVLDVPDDIAGLWRKKGYARKAPEGSGGSSSEAGESEYSRLGIRQLRSLLEERGYDKADLKGLSKEDLVALAEETDDEETGESDPDAAGDAGEKTEETGDGDPKTGNDTGE